MLGVPVPGPVGPESFSDLPLCVDMDGTLLRIDTLHESAAASLFDWRCIVRMPGWLLTGKAKLKEELAKRWTFDPAKLPYNSAILAYLEREHAAGRCIVLCTASHRIIAEKVAAQVGLFDAVIATENGLNLRGEKKAKALCDTFGADRYVYVGNDRTDHAVWSRAAAAVVAYASPAVRRDARARHNVISEIGTPSNYFRSLLKEIRPYQWIKNALCLVPPIAAGDFSNVNAWTGAVAVAVAFCAIASSVYIINDISDLAADRAHPRKSRRPFASGDLPISLGLAFVPFLLLVGAIIGWLTGSLWILAVYFLVSMSYLWLKTRPLVDVFVLAFLYTSRIVAGGEGSGHTVSIWLLGFSSFLFLSLALMKRVSELKQQEIANAPRNLMRRGYWVDDYGPLMIFGVGSTFSSAVVLLLYVQSDVAALYPNPAVLLGLIPLLLFWQCRLWLSTGRGFMHDDPIVYASRDWVSWIVVGLIALVGAAAWLSPRGLINGL